MKKTLIFSFAILASVMMFAQTMLINPYMEGGFEMGPDFSSNGWILENGVQTNQWFVGTVPVSPNNNSAYISNDAGLSWSYTNTISSVVHFYRDITFPAGETDIQLSFLLRGIGESTFDRLRIYLIPTSTTPTAGTEITSGQIGLANYNLQGAWIKIGLQVPASAAGTTQRLVFSWRNDGSLGSNPPVSIDNISLVSKTPSNLNGIYFIDNTIPTGGSNFNSFIDAILTLNSAVISGPLQFVVTSGQQFTEILPVITATGTSANSILFTKSGTANPTIITGGFSATTDAVVAINGGDYFTFSGFNFGLADPLQATVEYGYYVYNASATNGAQYNRFLLTNITLNKANTTSTGVYQNVATAPTNVSGSNSNNIYSNITISNSYNGIVCRGNATYPDLSTQINDCIVGADSPNDIGNGTSAISGIRITSGRDVIVQGNIVRNVNVNGGANLFGIFMENIQGPNNQIFKNKVYNLSSTSSSTLAYLQGLRVDVTSGNQASVHNNVVYGFAHAISTASSAMVARGIAINVTGTGTIGVTYNSVHLEMGAAATNTAIWTGGGTIFITNNIFANSSTPGTTSNRYAIYRNAGTLSSNYNNFFISAGTNNWLGYYTTNQIDLLAWQTASSGDMNSVNINPIFTGVPDLKPANPAMNNLGIVVPITDDITGAPRDPSTPDMGAYEYTPPTCLNPINLDASGITHNSATLEWTSSAPEFQIEWGIAGFIPGTGTLDITTDTSYSLSGLNSSTIYEFYVRAICGVGDTSLWTGPKSFVTQTVVPAPYYEGFPTTAIPVGYNTTGWTIGSVRGVLGNPANNIFKNFWSSATTGTFTTVNIGPIATGMVLSYEYIVANWSSPYAPPAVGSGGFTIEISTDYGNTYTLLDSVPNNGVAGYQLKNYNLTAYAGQIVKLRFVGQWISGDYDLAFDNITIDFPPACPDPIALTATGITENSATLEWTSYAAEFQIEWGIDGFIPGTGTLDITTDTSYSLSGLTASTIYEFYVRAICGVGDTSSWAGPYSFATSCPTTPYTLPFSEDFEGVICWTAYDEDGGGQIWGLGTAFNHTPGGSVAVFHNYGAIGYDESGWLYSPEIIIPSGGMIELSFWSYNEYPLDYGLNSLFVVYNGGMNVDSLWSETAPAASWGETTLDLSYYAGDTISLAFRYQGTFAHSWYLDDVQIIEVNSAVITPDSANYDLTIPADVVATITWNDASTISTIVDDQGTPYTLIENTDYTISGTTLTILNSYLSNVLLAVGNDINLEIHFDLGIDTLTITAIQTPAVPEVIAHWMFEDTVKQNMITDQASFLSSPYTADDGIPANINIAPFSNGGGTAFAGWVAGSGGTGTFAPNGNTWENGDSTKYWSVVISTSGYETLKLSSKQRGSSTGPRDFKVQYSTDGITWIDVPGTTIVVAANFTSGVLTEVELPAACNNQSVLMLRWIMTSDTSVAGGTIGATGTNRIDDILITGEPVTTNIIENTSDIKVYPNPSNGQFVIESNDNWVMMVFDISGRMISSDYLNKGSNEINLLNQPAGLYLIKLMNENQTQTLRIVIE